MEIRIEDKDRIRDNFPSRLEKLLAQDRVYSVELQKSCMNLRTKRFVIRLKNEDRLIDQLEPYSMHLL